MTEDNTLRVYDVHKDAPKWKFWIARLLGQEIKGRDGDWITRTYLWRRKFYVFDCQPDTEGRE